MAELVGDHPGAGALAVEQRRDRLPERVRRDPLIAGASANSPERGSHVVAVAVATEGVGEDRAFCYAEASPARLKHREAPPRQHEHSLRGVSLGPRRDETLSLDADDGALHAQGASVRVDVAPPHPERLAEAEAGGEDEAGQLREVVTASELISVEDVEPLSDLGRRHGLGRPVSVELEGRGVAHRVERKAALPHEPTTDTGQHGPAKLRGRVALGPKHVLEEAVDPGNSQFAEAQLAYPGADVLLDGMPVQVERRGATSAPFHALLENLPAKPLSACRTRRDVPRSTPR